MNAPLHTSPNSAPCPKNGSPPLTHRPAPPSLSFPKPFPGSSQPPATPEPILRAIRLIRTDFSRPLTIPIIARECGMSVRHLQRLYRATTGTTIGRDLIRHRIAAAANSLREAPSKLEPLALETGFSNAKNLCRRFKQHFGITPGQWRETTRRLSTSEP